MNTSRKASRIHETAGSEGGPRGGDGSCSSTLSCMFRDVAVVRHGAMRVARPMPGAAVGGDDFHSLDCGGSRAEADG